MLRPLDACDAACEPVSPGPVQGLSLDGAESDHERERAGAVPALSRVQSSVAIRKSKPGFRVPPVAEVDEDPAAGWSTAGEVTVAVDSSRYGATWMLVPELCPGAPQLPICRGFWDEMRS